MLKRLCVLFGSIVVAIVLVGSYVAIGYQAGVSTPEFWLVEIKPGSSSFDALLWLVMAALVIGAVHGLLHDVMQVRPMYDLFFCLALCMGLGLLIAMPGYGPFLVPVVPPLAYLVGAFFLSAGGRTKEGSGQPASA